MAAMRDDTPYHLRPASEVKREQACMRAIFGKAPDVDYIWEAFAGMGVTAEVLRDRFPRAIIEATDLDEECVQTYNEKGYGTAFQENALSHLKRVIPQPARAWGISLDYNKFTIFDLQGVREVTGERWKLDLFRRVLAAEPAWIQLTDSACRYLHLNWRNYGLPKNDIGDYVDALWGAVRAQPGGRPYDLVDWAKHHAASYHLFVRSD